MDIEAVTMEVVRLVKKVGSYIQAQVASVSSENVLEKGLHDLVTYVDKEAERRLVEGLTELVPGAGINAEEEHSAESQNGYKWIIDPLDGTTNFIHHVPVFSVSVALEKSSELVSGVVYELNRDECFYAWKSGGAFLNGKPITVSQTEEMDRALLATGFPYSDFSQVEPYISLLQELMKNSRGIRRLGSAAVDLAYTACGRFDLFYEYALHPWDVAAGIVLVREAGGRVTDFSGKTNQTSGKQIIASNGLFHSPFLERLNAHFY